MKHIHTFESFLNEEIFTDKAYDKFIRDKNNILSSIPIEINARVDKGSEIRFVYPFLNTEDKFEDSNKGLKAKTKWLKGIQFINVEIQSKKPVGYNVLYSGTIETAYGTEEFKDISNGFSIGMG